MQNFGSTLCKVGWIVTLGSVAAFAVVLLPFMHTTQLTGAQIVEGIILVVLAVLVLPAGLIALLTGYVIRWSSRGPGTEA
jgi:hypothetical protein